MSHVWDPSQYLTYADERGRPFFDLVGRVRADAPERVVDLGCGPGNLTTSLAVRWPDASVVGVDSSAEMIAAAPTGAGVTFVVGDLRDWARDAEPVDVLVSNATLQWVDGHLDLLPDLAAAVKPGGWLAFQVPGNFAEPSHTIRTELAADERFAPHLAGVAVPSSHDPADYQRRLAGLGFVVDAWETTYLHVLHGPDAVFEWVSGTGARPTLQALPDDGTRATFTQEFRRRLRAAYPPEEAGVLLPFRRVFVVAQKAPEVSG
ncbi:methyltransferase domain-containing protein [Nocardioides sp. JQ2195]|uniref:methyltransferase domain-containing protein n=1 Tax=Nocardioides sp. JQ2195 TaxID=2592334 RepID=UPI00143E904E|nr:methyltransferase domain-containing protein [Nocardioides sp. JQ2195]QIX27994.1 methyltransferase domain-containing protein [Nocardioides sp. JQ2195]